MMKDLPVYVFTAPFLFVLTIMSGMGSGGVQSQIRHTENTVMKMRTSLFSHYIKPVMSDWKQSTRKKIKGIPQIMMPSLVQAALHLLTQDLKRYQ